MSLTIHPLTRDDYLAFHPDGVPYTVRGFSLYQGDTLVGIAGVMYSHPAFQAFSTIKPVVRKYPVTIMKTARKLAAILDTMQAPVFAIADEQYNTSEQFLQRVGFSHVSGRMYRWT